MPQGQVVHGLRQWSQAFHSIVDTGISLVITTTADGEEHRTPTLHGDIAFDRNLGGLYLSCEKVGRQLFSLRVLADRFSLLFPETGEIATGGRAAFTTIPYLVRPEEVQTMLAGPDALGLTWKATVVTLRQGEYTFDVPVFGTTYWKVRVDAITGTVTAVERYDARGRLVTRMLLSDYRPLNDTQFPCRMVVERPSNGVQVELRLGRPRLNKQVRPQAFAPHRIAGRKHWDLDDPNTRIDDIEAFRAQR
jgi:hypothetical protein